MTDDENRIPDYEGYLRDLVAFLRDELAEARRDKKSDRAGVMFHEGRDLALVGVLSFMQTQADALMIPRGDLGLAGLDPLRDDLKPSER